MRNSLRAYEEMINNTKHKKQKEHRKEEEEFSDEEEKEFEDFSDAF